MLRGILGKYFIHIWLCCVDYFAAQNNSYYYHSDASRIAHDLQVSDLQKTWAYWHHHVPVAVAAAASVVVTSAAAECRRASHDARSPAAGQLLETEKKRKELGSDRDADVDIPSTALCLKSTSCRRHSLWSSGLELLLIEWSNRMVLIFSAIEIFQKDRKRRQKNRK